MIVVGIGCRRDSPAARIAGAVRQALAKARMPVDRVDALATPEFKANETGILEASVEMGLPLSLVERSRMDAVQVLCATRSETVELATGLGAVSEAAAIAAAGRNAVLLLPRFAYEGVTCAVARGEGA